MDVINIVTDCDEVLTNISPLWIKKIHEERESFEKFFKLYDTFDHMLEEDLSKVLTRPQFHLNKWLRKDNLNLTELEEKELFKSFFDIYDNDDFYSDCLPTPMCQGLYKLSLQKFVGKIYVVTRTSEKTKESKRRFIETYLNSPKVEIIFVGKDEKKSDYINKLKNVKSIIEDELSNIHDILDNCTNIEETDFYIPYTGYNEPDADLFDKADEKKVKLLYYPILENTQVVV